MDRSSNKRNTLDMVDNPRNGNPDMVCMSLGPLLHNRGLVRGTAGLYPLTNVNIPMDTRHTISTQGRRRLISNKMEVYYEN